MKGLAAYVVLLITLATLAGCKKTHEEEQPKEIELSFTGIKIDQLAQKEYNTLCYIETADYAKAIINGTSYYPEVFYLNINGVTRTYTQSIKLPYDPNSTNLFTVEQFHLMDDQQTPNDKSDDVIIASIPAVGSDFAMYVSTPVNFSIRVEEFKKLEVPVQVLCFEPDQWESFGFDWFAIEEIAILEQCFFGDLCVQNPNDYIGSLYEQQSGPLQMDMPAIFKVEVYRNGEFEGEFSNESWLGEGQPLCITYKDYLHNPDLFEFLLYVLVKTGNYFDYRYFHYWSFSDNEMISDGSDGVVDFVLGPCATEADFFLPAYMNIPFTATLKTKNFAPGNPSGGYINSKLSGIPSGFDISNGDYASWNLDHQLNIVTGASYSMDVYSSLYTFYGPDFLENEQWDKVNWIMNHLDWYPGHTWEDIQGAFWLLDLQEPWNGNATGGIPDVTLLQYAQQMKTDADAYGTGFEPSWGEQAAVIFTEQGTPQGAAHPNLIIVFIEITQ